MLRSDLIIAGSNFIFSHINENYSSFLNSSKKLLTIFRGINLEYFDSKQIKNSEESKLIEEWKIDKSSKLLSKKNYSFSWKINFLERSRNVY